MEDPAFGYAITSPFHSRNFSLNAMLDFHLVSKLRFLTGG